MRELTVKAIGLDTDTYEITNDQRYAYLHLAFGLIAAYLIMSAVL